MKMWFKLALFEVEPGMEFGSSMPIELNPMPIELK
jgi:hypothetical protein